MFPSELVELLHAETVLDKSFPTEGLLRQLREGDPLRKAQVKRNFALPHPLDYEWLFTTETAKALADRAIALDAESVLCVGTPSVFAELTGSTSAKAVLLDRPHIRPTTEPGGYAGANTLALDRYGLVADLIGLADVAIVDSPWYPEYIIYFTSVAAACLKPGGIIFSAVPPRFTRPGIDKELGRICSALACLGITFIGSEQSAVRYQAPPFEVATLKELGLHGVPHEWRLGDVLLFQVDRLIDPSLISAPVSSEQWQELSIGPSRVKFRKGENESQDASLVAVTRSGVMPSVSRRNPMRHRVNVWTSGNRGFECHAPTVLFNGVMGHQLGDEACGFCERKLSIDLTPHERLALRESIRSLFQLAAEEETEIAWQ
jgi:hypothetical protein